MKRLSQSEKFDYVVIGGGIAGLISACTLKMQGYKVAICEQYRKLGGCFSLVKSDLPVPYGAHHIGLPNSPLLHELFHVLNFDYEKETCISSKYCVWSNDKIYNMSLNFTDNINLLSDYFPKEKNGLVQLENDFTQYLAIAKDIEADKQMFLELYSVSYEEFLARYRLSDDIINLLTALGPGFGAVDKQDSAFTFISLYATYGNGAYYFMDNGKVLLQKMTNYLLDGASIYLKTKVDSIRYIENDVYKLACTASDKTVYAKNLILACYPNCLLEQITEGNKKRERFISKVNRLVRSKGAVRTFYQSRHITAMSRSEYMFYKYPFQNQNIDFIISILPDNYLMATFIGDFSSNSSVALSRLGKQLIEDVLCIKEIVEITYVSSFHRAARTQNPFGSIVGWHRDTKNNMAANIFKKTSSYFPHVYTCGHWSFSFGFYGSILSALDNLTQ